MEIEFLKNFRRLYIYTANINIIRGNKITVRVGLFFYFKLFILVFFKIKKK